MDEHQHSHIRTAIAFAKGAGAAGHGTHHWLLQRITALALIPLVVWLVSWGMHLLVHAYHSASHPHGVSTSYGLSFASAVLLILFIGMALYHGMLGMKVVIEDYTPHIGRRTAYILLLYMVTMVTTAVGVVGVLAYYVR